jgi:hypothetical protein
MTRISSHLIIRLIAGGVALIFLGVCGVCSALSLYVAYTVIGSVQPSPDLSQLSTAEYLYEHPQPPPEGMTISIYDAEAGIDASICYRYSENGKGVESDLANSIFLNGALVPRVMFTSPNPTDGSGRAYCFKTRALEKGLHLLELQLRHNLWDRPIFYQSAVLKE